VDGVPPSYEELQAELGIGSKSKIHYLLHRMRDRGLVTFEPRRARTVRVLEAIDHIDLAQMSPEQLTALRSRIEAELVNRWVL
jgi:SOS-response transcriptional repressor LexA